VRIGIVLSSAAAASVTHSTVHLAQAALEAGHLLRVLEPWDFEVDPRGRVRGRAHVFDEPLAEGDAGREALVAALIGRAALRRNVEVDRLDVLLLRVNPLDEAVVTYAQLAQAAGVRVVNAPDTILRTSHKAWLATLTGVPVPRTVVTRSRATIERFASECEAGVVVKPARSCGGKGVSVARGRRRGQLDTAVDAAMRHGDGYVVVQEYLPEAADGEKRLLWHDGAFVGGYLRQRPPGEFRHNLKVGGTPHPCVLTESDHSLARALGPHLVRAGVWFAGVDVIGGRVVEVNTLNPGGIHYTEQLTRTVVARRLVASLAPSPAPSYSLSTSPPSAPTA
jgi:glutathione synthase